MLAEPAAAADNEFLLCGSGCCSRHATHAYNFPGDLTGWICDRCIPLLRKVAENHRLNFEDFKLEALPDPRCEGCDSRRSHCAALAPPAIKCCPDCSHR